MVQRYPGAVKVHWGVAIHRGVGIRRPDDCLLSGVGVPDGEGESVCSKLMEAAREGGIW